MPHMQSKGEPLLEVTNTEVSPAAATTKNKANCVRVFEGFVFAFAGRFPDSQVVLKNLVESGGGTCAASVTLKVTHVIATKAAVDADKRSAAIATAIGRSLPILSVDFLKQSVEQVQHRTVLLPHHFWRIFPSFNAEFEQNNRTRCWTCTSSAYSFQRKTL